MGAGRPIRDAARRAYTLSREDDSKGIERVPVDMDRNLFEPVGGGGGSIVRSN
jgi:hypothetical protein